MTDIRLCALCGIYVDVVYVYYIICRVKPNTYVYILIYIYVYIQLPCGAEGHSTTATCACARVRVCCVCHTLTHVRTYKIQCQCRVYCVRRRVLCANFIAIEGEGRCCVIVHDTNTIIYVNICTIYITITV